MSCTLPAHLCVQGKVQQPVSQRLGSPPTSGQGRLPMLWVSSLQGWDVSPLQGLFCFGAAPKFYLRGLSVSASRLWRT